MKNKLFWLAIVAVSMLPLQAFAVNSYYYVVMSSTGTATWGPFPSLGECQEALAKMQGKGLRKDASASSCFAK
ncbi:hypothetical protein EDC63_10615 [Sulfurirhabdus autotrophica]|uniref:Uncharacterized protein n=2 Tax=Sulfurirhabdus autotrophica TaxID=1706046 RepID=A0A4R3Y7W2_9PROT|nr:hypothetical protein EDC63_10615 [Sulfurirhabdus autotrophica]